MNVQVIFWTLLALAMLIGVPIALVWTIVDYFRGSGSERQGTGGFTSGIAASMQELDRLMARPSVEHQVEAEQPILKREDGSGGQ